MCWMLWLQERRFDTRRAGSKENKTSQINPREKGPKLKERRMNSAVFQGFPEINGGGSVFRSAPSVLYPKGEIYSLGSAGTPRSFWTAADPCLPASRQGRCCSFSFVTWYKGSFINTSRNVASSPRTALETPASCLPRRGLGQTRPEDTEASSEAGKHPSAPGYTSLHTPGAGESSANGLTNETHNLPPRGIFSTLFCLYRIPSRWGGCLLKKRTGEHAASFTGQQCREKNKTLQQMSMSHLPSLCWAWSALLERHLQNHNLQKRGIKLRIRKTSSGEGGEAGGRGEREGGIWGGRWERTEIKQSSTGI